MKKAEGISIVEGIEKYGGYGWTWTTDPSIM